MNLAIIGATGNVGRKTIEILEKSKIIFDNLYLVASKKSLGQKILFKGNQIEVEQLEKYDFSRAEITFLQQEEKYQKIGLRKHQKKQL
tara:strand:- start:512 stop:775 length:264 start_codon:yes stop_codon:yes gene_type:complete